MKKGYFSSGSRGLMKRKRGDWRGIKKEGRYYMDVFGTKNKSRKDAASGNAFIRIMGL